MATGPDHAVRVEGLREFRRALRDLEGGDFPAELSAGFKSISQFIAEKTASAFSSGPGVAPKVAASVRALTTSVKIGGAAWPFTLGAEFGGQRTPRTQQFRPWRGDGSGAGYFLYPTIRENNEAIGDRVADLFDRIAAKAFPD